MKEQEQLKNTEIDILLIYIFIFNLRQNLIKFTHLG